MNTKPTSGERIDAYFDMSSDAPNAQRIKRALPMTEKDTVDRAIEIEERLQQIAWELDRVEVIYQRRLLERRDTTRIDQKWEELQSEWDNLVKEYKG